MIRRRLHAGLCYAETLAVVFCGLFDAELALSMVDVDVDRKIYMPRHAR